MSLLNKLFKVDGLTKKEIETSTERSQFSKFLPWIAYDPENKFYINQDNTIGFIFECSPVAFTGYQLIDTLEGLFRLDVPDRSVIQFILFADPDISLQLNKYKNLKKREEVEVLKESVERFTDYLKKGITGLEKISNIPIRDHRLFFTFKVPIEKINDKSFNLLHIKTTSEEILRGARLYPFECPPTLLLDWLRRVLNGAIGKTFENSFLYDENKEIKKQVILSDTIIEKNKEHLKIGDIYCKCTTPKLFPKDVSPYQTNVLFGGIRGISTDMDQITSPYIYTLNVVFENLKTSIHTKCSLVLQQQAVGSFAPSLMRKKDEYLWAADELEKGTKFFRIIPIFWVLGNSKETSNEAIVKVKRMWEQEGYIMQEDKGILDVLFVSSLPFGLYNVGKNIENLDRDFIAPASSIAPVLPIQADYTGGGDPHLIFIGRKGQLCSLNIFDKSANNSNALVMGTTGSGKSFFVNYFSINEFACGSMLRIVDIGGSYKKLIKLCNARYLDFSPEETICVNPFTNVRDVDIDIPSIISIVSQMAYSQSDDEPDETEWTLIKQAVQWAYDNFENSATLDNVYEYLKVYPSFAPKEIVSFKSKDIIIEKAHQLAFNLRNFTSDGSYGKYFNGESEFDITHDEFVVLELEHLLGRTDLFKVVTKLVITAVTQDLYLSDRSRNKVIIFDEFWQYGKGNLLKETCESAYRRVRKYGGSIIIITQSVLDMKQFGELGDVLMGNSAFKFFLEMPNVEKAKSENLISYDEFTINLLKTLQSNRPKYSELFIDSPFGQGVVRLVVDPFSYWVYTSDAKEVSTIENMVASGMSYKEAIENILASKK